MLDIRTIVSRTTPHLLICVDSNLSIAYCACGAGRPLTTIEAHIKEGNAARMAVSATEERQ